MKGLKYLFIGLILFFQLPACSTLSSTSSTSGAITPDMTANDFVDKRYIAIRQDAANGSGEHIYALSQILGYPDSALFAKQVQANFDGIFTDVKEPAEIVSRIKLKIMNNNS